VNKEAKPALAPIFCSRTGPAQHVGMDHGMLHEQACPNMLIYALSMFQCVKSKSAAGVLFSISII